MAGLSWSVKLDDKISAGAKSAASSLGALGKKLEEVRSKSKISLSGNFTKIAGLDTAATKLGLFSRAVQAAGNAFGPRAAGGLMAAGRAMAFVGDHAGKLKGVLAGLGSVATVAVAALAAAGAAALGAGIALAANIGEMQAFSESMRFSLEKNTGSAKAGAKAWGEIQDIALSTGADLRETGAAFNTLLSAGFAADEVGNLVKRFADLKALDPKVNVEGIARAMTQIKATGKLQGDELMQLNEAGLSTKSVHEALAKQLGKSTTEIQKMQEAGKITSDQALRAINTAMAERAGGKDPGAVAAEKASKTMIGAVGKLKAAWDVFASSLKIDFGPVSRFAERLGGVLKSDAGVKFGKALENAFNTVLGLLDGVSPEAMATGLTMATTAVNAFAGGLASAAEAVRTVDGWLAAVNSKTSTWGVIFAAVGGAVSGVLSSIGNILYQAILGPLGTIGAAVYQLIAGIANVDTGSLGAKLGQNFISGILAALTGSIGSVLSAASAVGDAMNSGTAGSIKSASPSKTAKELSNNYVDGFLLPAGKRLGEVKAAGAGIGAAANKGLSSADAAKLAIEDAVTKPISEAMNMGPRGGVVPPVSAQTATSFSDMFARVFSSVRSGEEMAATPSAAAVGSAAANVTNNATTNTRGPVSLNVTANNAEASTIAGMIESRLRSMDLAGG